jgi:hypothetical protein
METKLITVVITSCGRLNLLKRTLDSFHKFNTAPIFEYILVDDSGKEDIHNELKRLYPDYTLILEPMNRMQVTCIDDAYSRVKTPWIFHTEDDWEYYGYGFIEKSMEILEKDDKIINVWLRASDDTNGHPIEDTIYKAGNVEYRLMAPHYETQRTNGCWHGFSWAPGLRRLSDYKLLAPFAKLTRFPLAERLVGQAYFELGFRAAILMEGYVRHIGPGWDAKTNEEIMLCYRLE